MTEFHYELYVAFGADGEIEAATNQKTLKERWEECVDSMIPTEIRRMEFIRRVPDVVPVVLSSTEVTVQA